MKSPFKKIALCALAMLAIGGTKVQAATETFTFSNIGNNKWTTSGTTSVTTGGNTLNMLEIEGNTFGNRFAVSRAGTQSTAGWCLKQYNTQNGLFSQYENRYLSVLNLKDGDKVTVTWFSYNDAAGKLNFQSAPSVTASVAAGDEVVSGTTYTISTSEASVNLDFVTAKASSDPNIVIQEIVIVTAVTSVPVTVNIIPDASVEEYDFQALGQAQAAEGSTDVTYGAEVLTSPASIKLISFGDNIFGNRFAGNRDWAIRKHVNSAYCGLYDKKGYSSRYLAICNLKVGDKVSIKFICDSEQSLIFNNAIVEGVSANDAVVSEKEYVVTTAGALILDESSNTEDKRVYIYKVTIDPAAAHIGEYIGTTLVSSTALDFSKVDDVTAYVATAASAGSVTFSPVTKVVANTPLYIKANETSGAVLNVNVPEAEEGAVDYSTTNLLKGSASSATSLQSDKDTKYYVFGVKSGEAGFYPVSTSSTLTSAAGKAYLQLTAAQAAAASRIAIHFTDDVTTGIGASLNDKGEMTNDKVFNLQGQRVDQPTKGLYVKNGKKMFIK